MDGLRCHTLMVLLGVLGLGELPQLATTSTYPPFDADRVRSLLSEMTLREKLDETGIPTISAEDVPWRLSPLVIGKLSPGNFSNWFDLKENGRLGLRGMRTRDGPKGTTCNDNYPIPCPERAGAPMFPHQNVRANTWNTALEEEVGASIGEIARSQDVHAALMPCIEVLTWLNAGRGQESYGEDPLFNGKMGAAVVRGVQSKGTMATVKHFFANNIENIRWHVSAELDEKSLHEVFLKQWSIIVAESSPEFVMTSYNRVQGNWTNMDPKFIGLLRDKLGFEGSVMTDWFATTPMVVPADFKALYNNDASEYFGMASSSLKAGVDMEMPFNSRHIQAVRELAKCKGSDAEMCQTTNALNRNVAHLLRSKLRYDLLRASRPRPEVRLPGFNDEKYDALSLKIAQQGIVLLKNEASFLPQKPKDVSSVIVLGSAEELELGDHGSSNGIPSGSNVTVLQGLINTYGEDKVTYMDSNSSSPLAWQTWPMVAKADMIVVDVGTDFNFEGEFIPYPGSSDGVGGDRKYLNLHESDRQLIYWAASLNPNIVVAMSSGQVIVVEDFIEKARAVLWMGYPGTQGGQALADILSGAVNPAGRMSSSTPKSPVDWVPEGTTLEPWKTPLPAAVSYPYAHGFKHMWAAKIAPRYPMGWGLSYTTFSHGKPTLVPGPGPTGMTLRTRVSNTGSIAGIETVQVYVTCSTCKVKRLAILLVGFGKSHLDPGQAEEVSVAVSAKDFAVYDVKTERWLIEGGTYTVLTGPCADAAQLQGVDYVVKEDTWFEYPGPATPANIPGIEISNCEAFKCKPDADFNQEELINTMNIHLAQLVLLLFLIFCSIGLCKGCRRLSRCLGCCRCGQAKEKEE